MNSRYNRACRYRPFDDELKLRWQARDEMEYSPPIVIAPKYGGTRDDFLLS